MKKVITLAALVMAAFSITATTALASPGPVDTGKQACTASGRAVVNVHFTYTSPDSGLGGNNWANDTIHRQLQIWKVAGDKYCASVKDQGSFVTVAGTSPGATGWVAAGITGTMQGGYTTTQLTGTLNPSKPTRGDLGTFDHNNRPSFVSYGLSGDLADWGWSYQTLNNGSWVNASIPPGNSGDITTPITAVSAPVFNLDGNTCSVTVPYTAGIDTILYGVNGRTETPITGDVTVTGGLSGAPDTAAQFWIGYTAQPGYEITNLGAAPTHFDFYNGACAV